MKEAYLRGILNLFFLGLPQCAEFLCVRGFLRDMNFRGFLTLGVASGAPTHDTRRKSYSCGD